jgi:Zn-dependent membrane protease YugP
VLDYNFVILRCKMYHFTAFQNTCSLCILSLVLVGHQLEEDDQQKYLLFRDHIAPCVLVGHMKGVLLFILGSNLGGVGPVRGLRGGERGGWCKEWARSG